MFSPATATPQTVVLPTPNLIKSKQLPGGKWRIQVCRQNWPRINEAHFTDEAEVNARADELKLRFGPHPADARTLQAAWDK